MNNSKHIYIYITKNIKQNIIVRKLLLKQITYLDCVLYIYNEIIYIYLYIIRSIYTFINFCDVI